MLVLTKKGGVKKEARMIYGEWGGKKSGDEPATDTTRKG